LPFVELLYIHAKLKIGDGPMAKNTGDGYRKGAVKDRTQTYNTKTEIWTKRGEDGRFMDGKKDRTPFKGVTKEK
jgi:hypothetical protein